MSSIKRIHRDLLEWRESERHFRRISADPIEEDMFIWHFNMVAGKEEEERHNPLAIHGQIRFPTNYPFSPPTVEFFGNVPHRQVSRASRGKMAVLCLDMLQGRNQGYYSGWSSAYSVVSVLAQIETLLEDVPPRSIPHGWREFRCNGCSHDGSRPSSFHPQMRMCPPSRQTGTVIPSESRSTDFSWSRLNRDVEGIIFSYLSQNDYRCLVHVNSSIKSVLVSYRWYHWKTVECYHSHENFGGFVSAVQSNTGKRLLREDIFEELFGIGFSVDYFENERRGRTTQLVLKDVYVMPDVLCYRAFKEGVTFSMWRDARFTSFLPLYLNNLHGSHAMALAEDVIRAQYDVASNEVFEPTMVLKFLTKLMNTTVVSLMRELESQEESEGVHLFTSIKALQSYMYFYHLLLGFCKKYPRIASFARKKVYNFVKKADQRNKKEYPDLGEFLVYLAIVPSMKWEKFGPIFAEEAFVRNAKWILQKHPGLITTHRNSDTSCIRLRRTWEASKVGKRLQMFQYYFLHNICGVGSSDRLVLDLSAKLDGLNHTLGQVDETVAVGLQRRCRMVFQVDDWMQYFSMVNLPCPSARALTHLLRVSMLESDRKGYQRFVRLNELKEEDLLHEDADLCICSGTVQSLGQRDAAFDETKLVDESDYHTKRFLDVAFSVDCTGSMGSYLSSVKEHISTIATKLTTEVKKLHVRFAIVGYRDHGGEAGNWSPSVTKWYGFTDVTRFRKNLATINVGGGGGVEAVADAWHQVIGLNWRRHSVKAVIHIADIGGHGLSSDYDVCPDGHDAIVLARQMLESDITLYNVGCQMRGEIHEKFYKATAFMTGGLYLTLENALKLPEVIVESTREGMSLTTVLPQVHKLMSELKKERPFVTKDQLAYLVWRELVARRVVTRKVKCVSIDEELPRQVTDASKSRDLAECRRILNDHNYSKIASLTPMRSPVEPAKVSSHTRTFDEYQRDQKQRKRRALRAQKRRRNRAMQKTQAKEEEQKEQVRAEHDDRLITLEQTLRCIIRAEQMGNRLAWSEKGCLYQMEKYNVTAARARFSQHGMEYSGKLLRIKKRDFERSDLVEYNDCKTGRIYAASVVGVDPSKYSITIRVSGLNNARREVPLTSRSLRKMGTVLTSKNKSKHFSGVIDPALSDEVRGEAKVAESEERNQRNKRPITKREQFRAPVVRPPMRSHAKMVKQMPSVRVQVGITKNQAEGADLIRQIHKKTAIDFASMIAGRTSVPVVEETKQEESQSPQFPVAVICSAPPPPQPSLSPPAPTSLCIRSFSLSEADMSERSAMCVVLPTSLWEDIQVIRRQYDRQYQHWRLPAIKLLCPFVDRGMFEEHAQHLGETFRACGLEPFRVELTGFAFAECAPVHGKKMVEVFLKTKVVSGDDRSWTLLMDAISTMYPNRVQAGMNFEPRIVVGQIAKKNVKKVLRGLKADFVEGLTFRVSKVCLLSRCGFNAPFAAEHEVLFR